MYMTLLEYQLHVSQKFIWVCIKEHNSTSHLLIGFLLYQSEFLLKEQSLTLQLTGQ